MGHHLGLCPYVFHHLLMKMGLIVTSESIHAQGTPRHLQRHSKYAHPRKSIGGQMMDLQIEALQDLANKILSRESQPGFKKIMKYNRLIRLRLGHLLAARSAPQAA